MAKRYPDPSAVYTATSVQVDCPDCGESLPAPCGSLFWTIADLSKALYESPDRTCDSCDERFVMRQESKAHLSLSGVDSEDLARLQAEIDSCPDTHGGSDF